MEVPSPYFSRPSKVYKYIMPRNSRVGWWRDPICFYKRKHFHFPNKWILLHNGHSKHTFFKDSTILYNRKKGYEEYLNGEQQNWLMNCLNTRPFSKLLWKVDRAILLRRLKKKDIVAWARAKEYMKLIKKYRYSNKNYQWEDIKELLGFHTQEEMLARGDFRAIGIDMVYNKDCSFFMACNRDWSWGAQKFRRLPRKELLLNGKAYQILLRKVILKQYRRRAHRSSLKRDNLWQWHDISCRKAYPVRFFVHENDHFFEAYHIRYQREIRQLLKDVKLHCKFVRHELRVKSWEEGLEKLKSENDISTTSNSFKKLKLELKKKYITREEYNKKKAHSDENIALRLKKKERLRSTRLLRQGAKREKEDVWVLTPQGGVEQTLSKKHSNWEQYWYFYRPNHVANKIYLKEYFYPQWLYWTKLTEKLSYRRRQKKKFADDFHPDVLWFKFDHHKTTWVSRPDNSKLDPTNFYSGGQLRDLIQLRNMIWSVFNEINRGVYRGRWNHKFFIKHPGSPIISRNIPDQWCPPYAHRNYFRYVGPNFWWHYNIFGRRYKMRRSIYLGPLNMPKKVMYQTWYAEFQQRAFYHHYDTIWLLGLSYDRITIYNPFILKYIIFFLATLTVLYWFFMIMPIKTFNWRFCMGTVNFYWGTVIGTKKKSRWITGYVPMEECVPRHEFNYFFFLVLVSTSVVGIILPLTFNLLVPFAIWKSLNFINYYIWLASSAISHIYFILLFMTLDYIAYRITKMGQDAYKKLGKARYEYLLAQELKLYEKTLREYNYRYAKKAKEMGYTYNEDHLDEKYFKDEK